MFVTTPEPSPIKLAVDGGVGPAATAITLQAPRDAPSCGTGVRLKQDPGMSQTMGWRQEPHREALVDTSGCVREGPVDGPS